MSWKRGKRKPASSITLRLAIFYTIATLCILFLSSALLYWVLAKSFRHVSTDFLQNEVQAIADVLREHVNDWSALNQEVIWKPQSQSNHYYARVTTGDGQLVRETFGLDDIMLAGVTWPNVAHHDGALSQSVLIKADNHQTYMLLSGWLALGKPGNQSFLAEVALNVSHDQQLLWLYRQNLLFVTLFGTLCALLLSLFISRLGLRPLRVLTREVSKITAAQLNARLPYERPPKELSDLIVAFNMALDRIEESFDRLSAFSSDIAHELRTPINNLLVQTEVMLSRTRDTEEYEQLLSSNLEEYQHLSGIVDRLLFIARADNNNINLSKTPLAVMAEIRAVVDFVEAYAEEKHIVIKVTGDDQVQVEADATLLRNAFSNLLTNGVKYIQAHGKIQIDIQRHKNWVTIAITDNGPGIAEQHLPHIFDRFYRVDSDRAKQSGGSGLGLAIVKSIVDLHEGDIEIESEVGRGTTIRVTLPVADAIQVSC